MSDVPALHISPSLVYFEDVLIVQGCINHDILQRKGNQNCLCTAMLFDPIEMEREQVHEQQKDRVPFVHN